jgi:hypothetical protein
MKKTIISMAFLRRLSAAAAIYHVLGKVGRGPLVTS